MIENLTYINSQNLLADASAIIETAKNIACRSVNIALVQRNWLLGKRIADEQLGGQTREKLYGQKLVDNLAKELTEQYGSGFDRSNLYLYIRLLGRTIVSCYKWKTNRLVNGMKMRRQEKCGAPKRYSAIYLRSTIIECLRPLLLRK